jgi:hypothetical protein
LHRDDAGCVDGDYSTRCPTEQASKKQRVRAGRHFLGHNEAGLIRQITEHIRARSLLLQVKNVADPSVLQLPLDISCTLQNERVVPI